VQFVSENLPNPERTGQLPLTVDRFAEAVPMDAAEYRRVRPQCCPAEHRTTRGKNQAGERGKIGTAWNQGTRPITKKPRCYSVNTRGKHSKTGVLYHEHSRIKGTHQSSGF